MAKERTCIFCGKSYLYCPNCGEYQSKPRWMYNFDTEKCHDLYEVLGGYNIGKNTKEDVKAILDKYNITDYSEFSLQLQNKLNRLFSSSVIIEPKVEEVKVEENPIDENIVIEEETESIERPYRSRRNRKYNKKNNEDEANTEE